MTWPRRAGSHRLPVLLFGVGALGALVTRAIASGQPRLDIVAAVDRDPAKVGRRLGEIVPEAASGADAVIAPDLATAIATAASKPALLLHMTVSEPELIEPELMEAIAAGLDVVSASEAMFHPALRHAAFAARIDAAARAAGVTVTGCGINPGFIMDAVPLLLARATGDVTAIRLSRLIDVTGTGPGDIQHVGYGLTEAEFRAGIAAGRIHGHIGLPESFACLAERLDLPLDRVEESWETTLADRPIDSGTPELGWIAPGRIVGIAQQALGFAGEREVLRARLTMFYQPWAFGLEEADIIEIDGAHRIRASLRPAAVSLFGAAQVIVNAALDVADAPPGLLNVLDLPIAGARRGGWRAVLDPARAPQPGRLWLSRETFPGQ
jgi:2,4-diaminopentanoate dehydrogenase